MHVLKHRLALSFYLALLTLRRLRRSYETGTRMRTTILLPRRTKRKKSKIPRVTLSPTTRGQDPARKTRQHR